MGNFGKSLSRELGKNTGKWVSNKIFGDGWSTPHRITVQRERQERKALRDDARAYRQELTERKRDIRQNEQKQKQHDRERAQKEKERAIHYNTREVNSHNNYIEVIQTVHKDYSNPISWEEITKQQPPKEVKCANELKEYYLELTNKQVDEKIAEVINTNKFSFWKNILGRYYSSKYSWLFKISTYKFIPYLICGLALLMLFFNFIAAVVFFVVFFGCYFLLRAGFKDFQTALFIEEQTNELEEKRVLWFNEYMNEQAVAHQSYLKDKEEFDELLNIAQGVINNEEESYIYAMNYFKPFSDLKAYGSDISYTLNGNSMNVDFFVHSEEVIPNTTKRLIRNGLEIREDIIPVSRFNEIYQDYVCSCALRIGKEVFSLLPIEKVLVNAKAGILNSSTGNYDGTTILSVLFDRQTVDQLNFDLLDPSDSLKNFTANMSFRKTDGFSPVPELPAL